MIHNYYDVIVDITDFRERRDNYVPEISALEDETLLNVDANVQAMIKSMDFDNKDTLLDNLKVEGGQ